MSYTRLLQLLFCVFILLMFPGSSWAQDMSRHVRKAIQEDSKTSLMEAAEAFQYGQGVKTDIVEAARLYLRAASKGNFHAHYRIYLLWSDFSEQFTEPPFSYQQFTISQNEAIKNYERLLLKNKNDPELHFRLAQLYDPGIGIVNEESKISAKHYRTAAKLGHKEARETLRMLKKMGL